MGSATYLATALLRTGTSTTTTERNPNPTRRQTQSKRLLATRGIFAWWFTRRACLASTCFTSERGRLCPSTPETPRSAGIVYSVFQSLQHQEHTLNRGVGGKWQPEWFAGDAAVVFTCGWRLPSNKIASHRRVTSSSSNSSASVVGHVSSGRRLQTLTVLAKHHGNVCADNSSPTHAR